ncbi:MAG: hypothetical protein WCI47_03910, partial [bacterium]
MASPSSTPSPAGPPPINPKPYTPPTGTTAPATPPAGTPSQTPPAAGSPLSKLGAPPMGASNLSKAPSPIMKKLVLIGIIGGICLLVFGLIPLLLLQSNKGRIKPTPSTSPSVTGRPSVDASARSDAKQRFFFRKSGKITAYDMSITVPTSWEGKFSTQPAGAYAWTDTFLLAAHLSRYSALSSTDFITQSPNYFALIDSSDWLNSTTKNPITLAPA